MGVNWYTRLAGWSRDPNLLKIVGDAAGTGSS